MRSGTHRTLGIGVVAVVLATSLGGVANAGPTDSAESRTGPTGASRSDGAGVPRTLGPDAKSCYSNLDGLPVTAITSQNFEAKWDDYDVTLADDVTIGSKRCVVKSITVIGEYYNGDGGVADSETVTFYKDKKGAPGKVVDRQTVVGDDEFGVFDIALDKVRLKKKTTYWVSVQANMSYEPDGEWGWETTDSQFGDPAVYKNPADGFGTGCTKWSEMQQCVAGFGPGPDLMFELVKK